FTELSPSKKGLHLWYKCKDSDKLPDGNRADKAEVYARGRYFTVSFNPVKDSPLEVTEVDLTTAKQIFELVKSCMKSEPAVEVQLASKTTIELNSEKFKRLMNGDFAAAGFPSPSEAVQSLLIQLMYKHGLDRVAAEQEFLTSKFYTDTHWKDKWEQR